MIYTLVHSALFATSLSICYLLFFDLGRADYSMLGAWLLESQFLQYLPLFVILKLIIFARMHLLRGGWRYSGIGDVVKIMLANWVFVVIVTIAMLLFYSLPLMMNKQPLAFFNHYFSGFPKRIFLLDYIITVFLVCSARLGYRIYCEEFRFTPSAGTKRILIIGAGDAGESLIREIRRMSVRQFNIVGLVDDSPAKQSLAIHSVRVLGTTRDIPELCKTQRVEELLIALPSATPKQIRNIIDICKTTKLQIRLLPGVSELINGQVTVSQIRPIDINDLLGRKPVELNPKPIAEFLGNRIVGVTGAGGSIGSEMCRQICAYKPSQLILMEQAETPLFEIGRELDLLHPDIPRIEHVCDIYDRERVFAIIEQTRPDVIIHAAAHKHVPLMENDPCEAIKNNIIGTLNVADAAVKYSVSEFVNISTDKAVNPSSIMGCSKRIAEIYIQSLNNLPHCHTQFKAVRFGNVLDSNGSVVPIFRKQIAAGGPLTVTHPEMTRYFMTISEASQLVLQAASIGEGGQIFLLDMGEPVKILDLAKEMITLSGMKPGEDIEIRYTGTRPGEKLFEELRCDDEHVEHTVHPKVLVWAGNPTPFDTITEKIKELRQLVNETDRTVIIRAFMDIVPEYQPIQPESDNAPGLPEKYNESE